MGAFDGFFGRIVKWDIKEMVKMADNLGPMHCLYSAFIY